MNIVIIRLLTTCIAITNLLGCEQELINETSHSPPQTKINLVFAATNLHPHPVVQVGETSDRGDEDKIFVEGLPPLVLGDHINWFDQCGDDDKVDVRRFKGTEQFSSQNVQDWSKPSVLFKWKSREEIRKTLGYTPSNYGNIEELGWCSGTIIDENTILTAGHCFLTRTGKESSDIRRRYRTPTDAEGVHLKPSELAQLFNVVYNYERDTVTRLPTTRVKKYNVISLQEFEVKRLDDTVVDYAILKFDAKGDNLQPQKISNSNLDISKPIVSIHHPGGRLKKVSIGNISDSSRLHYSYDNLDTLGGSSGAGILNKEGKIAGIHLYGGCKDEGANRGLKIEALLARSPTLKRLAH